MNKKVCPICNGEGEIDAGIMDSYMDIDDCQTITCYKCKGTGEVE